MHAKLNSILHRNSVNIFPKCGLFELFFVSLPPNIQLKYVFIMARPIRETPVLKGEDAFNFEMRRLEVEHMSKEHPLTGFDCGDKERSTHLL